MRSFVAFAALALSAADLASAGPCKPRPTTTAAATETSAAGGADATTLPEPPVNEPIVNACEGGGMTDLTIFTTVGDVKPNTQDGFTNDGSPDTACAQLSAQAPGPTRKRQNAGDVAALGQSLTGLNTRTMYTIQFYYRVATPPSEATACTLEAFIGDLRFFNTGIFANGASVSYNQVLVSTSVPVTEGELNIKTTCANGGSASVLIDSIFMSNQVTPENIDNYRLDFGDGEIREPVNQPATTVGTQLPPTTQDGAATGTEAADSTSTAPAGNGNGNGNGNSSVQPTSAAQGEATSNPTQGSSESTEAGASKPTTAAQEGEETSQPTQGSGSQPTTVAGGDSTVTTRAAGNDNDATTQTQGSGSQPTTVSQGSGSDATTVPAGSDATTVSQGSGSQPTTVSQGSGSDATTVPQGSDATTVSQGSGSQPTTVSQGAESDATTVSQGSGSDATTVSQGPGSQPTTVTQDSGSDATTETQGSGSQPTTVSQGSGSQPTTATQGSDATTASEESAETKTDSPGTQTSEAASEQTQSSNAETRTNTVDSEQTQTETPASQGTQSSASASEQQTQATSTSAPTTTAPAGTESTSAAAVDGSNQSTTASVAGESVTTTTAPAGTESTSAPVISESSATSSSTPDETTSSSSSEATEAFVARAEPARTQCVSASNLVENGDFEGVDAEWAFTGSAAAVHDKEIGPRAHTIGPYGVGFVGPDTGSFSQNIRNLEVGGSYYLSYAYFIASGEGLPENQCTVKVILGLDEVETFDPFQDSEAWNGYRNHIFQVSPSTADSELSFELSCTGEPNAFTVMMDDIYLIRCNE